MKMLTLSGGLCFVCFINSVGGFVVAAGVWRQK
jgi:hypothetical protein